MLGDFNICIDLLFFFCLMIRRPPRSTQSRSSAASDVYKRQVFTQAALWNINAFDQWGVELGKELAQRIIPELESIIEPALAHDSSTNSLIRQYRKRKHLQ